MNLYCSCIICVYKYLIYMWLHLYHLYMHIYVCIWMCIYVIYTYICNIWKMHTYSHFFNVHIRQTNPATIQQLTSWDRSIQFKSNETKSKST
jgi:ABC-type transport system involved in Fe-S cluster assembly fused permease/ATPase subunit